MMPAGHETTLNRELKPLHWRAG